MTPFLADENIPGASIRRLRAGGLGVTSVQAETPGITDPAVLGLAVQGGRILLTLDKGFGRLIYSEHRLAPPGVVFFRYDESPEQDEPAVDLPLLLADPTAPIEGFFVTIDRRLVRRRPLPSRPDGS